MSEGFRYLASEAKFKHFAYQAIDRVFDGRKEFEEFYSGITEPHDRDEFLRVSSFYLFLVRRGEWYVCVDGSNPHLSYLSNSYKLTALFSLIESLSNEDFVDFHQWLVRQPVEGTFPISNVEDLDKLYAKYKEAHGAIRRCVKFFEGLSEGRQEELCKSVEIGESPIKTIKKLAQFLYNLRSKFVHEARLALNLDDGLVLSKSGKKRVVTRLNIQGLLVAFEEGVVAHFLAKT